jgi:mono/diheme cytochrome c family protein
MKIWAIGIGIVGTLALLAGLHHIVVVTARGTAFSNAFAGSCHWCHGDAYEGFGTASGGEPPSAGRGAPGTPASPDWTARQ